MLKNTLRTITFLFFTFTIFFLFSVETVKAFSLYNFFNNDNGSVLGDDDKEDEDEDEDKDDDKDEDKDEDGDHKDDDKDEDRDEDEDEDEREVKTEETINNSDGSQTRIKREVKDGEEKVEIKTYDVYGNKIQELKIESDDEQVEVEAKDKSASSVTEAIRKLNLGDRLSGILLTTDDGRTIDIKVKSSNEESRLKYDAESGKLVVNREREKSGESEIESETESEDSNDESENEVEIEVEDNGFKLKSKSTTASVNFPLIVDEETGEIYVQTPAGQVLIGLMPDVIVEKALLSEVRSVKVEVENEDLGDSLKSTVEYKVLGKKKAKLLGLFEVEIDEEVTLDAQNGEITDTKNTSFVSSILDLLSF